MPNTIATIGAEAFRYCSSLTSITIPSSLKSVGAYGFQDCTSITSVRISDLAAWCNISFANRSSSPNRLEGHLYVGDEEVKELVIPDGVTNIGNYAFAGCGEITSLTIPNSVTTIGEYSFDLCLNLATVNLSNSLLSIGRGAFSQCRRINSLNIPNSVTKIEDRAFFSCSGLESLVIGNGVASIGNSAFQECVKLFSVVIPNNVTSIGKNVFQGCYDLKTVTLSEELAAIEESTFQGCMSLTNIIIPAKVSYIYQSAFAGCWLEEVKVLAETPPFAYANTFSNYDIPLYVPDSSISAYQKTSPWSNFTSFKTLSGEEFEKKKCSTPTISYVNGQLKMSCATEDVEYVTDIMDADVKKHYDATISLTATYDISAYATKGGYENSDIATATLCWIEAEPKPENITGTVVELPSKAILIQNEGGVLTVQGADDNTQVRVYTIEGKLVGEGVSQNGIAEVSTTLQPGSVAIVKIGKKGLKITMK
jgi:hypothetical protein